jgi:phage terminase large subunit-like protein
VQDLVWDYKEQEDGKRVPVIISGVPTWEGQSLEICEKQMREWGPTAFLQESQHDLDVNRGFFFDELAAKIIPRSEAWDYDYKALARGWDIAGTQAGGDYTVGVLMGLRHNGTMTVLDVVRGQFSADKVDELKTLVREWDYETWGPTCKQVAPQEPGAAGKMVESQDRKVGMEIDKTRGKKAKRATPYAEDWNAGNITVSEDGYSRTAELDRFLAENTRKTELEGKTLFWVADLQKEHRRFTEDETHEYDDQIDAGATAYNKLLLSKATSSAPPQRRARRFLG